MPVKKSERIQEIPLSELHPFKNHPFRVVDDEAMQRTVESVAQFGVLAPALARPRPEGGYELVAGHRRMRASELAGLETMPVIVRQMDDDTATIAMVDSNLQRETLLPSERAFAYKMKMDAMARRAGRPSKENSGQVGRDFQGKESREIIAEQTGKDVDEITLETNVKEDLDADSLDLFQIINDIEDEFDVSVEDPESIVTVKDAVDFVESHKEA